MGARWNPEIKKWYINDSANRDDFERWLPRTEDVEDVNAIVMKNIYVIEGKRQCWKCKKETPVIGIGIKDVKGLKDLADEVVLDGMIHIFAPSSVDLLPHNFVDYLQKQHNLKMKKSQTTNKTYLGNCCTYCHSLQGDFFLFEEVDSPFNYYYDVNVAKNLVVYKIPVTVDIPIHLDSWNFYMSASTPIVLENIATVINVNLEL
jgi:hypothetical protein